LFSIDLILYFWFISLFKYLLYNIAPDQEIPKNKNFNILNYYQLKTHENIVQQKAYMQIKEHLAVDDPDFAIEIPIEQNIVVKIKIVKFVRIIK